MTSESPNIFRILLVEDSGLQAKATIKTLNELGYKNIIACPNAAAAMEKLKSAQFNLVLCDWQMPGKSGLEFLVDLRANPDFAELPFIFLTAQADKTHVIEALRSGAQDYIVKPPSAAMLGEKVKRYAEKAA